ncbi:MAG: hypothetical protein ABFQ95_01095 [Pseudomonadota bacterium]
MTWTGGATPDGTKSVKDNKSIIQDNFAYTESTMQKDHFFDDANSNLDGRHQFAQMPKNESGGNPDDPTIATDMDLVYYSKEKTSTEAPDLQMVEPFAISNDGTSNQVMQMGFRALIHFEVGPSPTFTITPKYSHNCTVARTGPGLFTLTFTTPMPTSNYIFFGTALRSSGNGLVIVPQSGTKAIKITASSLSFATVSTKDSDARDPLVVTLAVCGG